MKKERYHRHLYEQKLLPAPKFVPNVYKSVPNEYKSKFRQIKISKKSIVEATDRYPHRPIHFTK